MPAGITIMERLEHHLSPQQRELLSHLTSPEKIQAFLDSIPYSAEDVNRCPLRVLQDRKAHCYDGAFFAATALRRIGYPPIVVDMMPEPGRDDDHLLAIFKRDGLFGAVAKSNFVGLRYREAIHRTLRELILSYFEDYFNVDGEKTLRAYTRPLDLRSFDRLGWELRDEGVNAIEERLWQIRRFDLFGPEAAEQLSPVDPRALAAGLFGSDPEGLFKPDGDGN
jgi:hypothetical protein